MVVVDGFSVQVGAWEGLKDHRKPVGYASRSSWQRRLRSPVLFSHGTLPSNINMPEIWNHTSAALHCTQIDCITYRNRWRQPTDQYRSPWSTSASLHFALVCDGAQPVLAPATKPAILNMSSSQCTWTGGETFAQRSEPPWKPATWDTKNTTFQIHRLNLNSFIRSISRSWLVDLFLQM